MDFRLHNWRFSGVLLSFEQISDDPRLQATLSLFLSRSCYDLGEASLFWKHTVYTVLLQIFSFLHKADTSDAWFVDFYPSSRY